MFSFLYSLQNLFNKWSADRCWSLITEKTCQSPHGTVPGRLHGTWELILQAEHADSVLTYIIVITGKTASPEPPPPDEDCITEFKVWAKLICQWIIWWWGASWHTVYKGNRIVAPKSLRIQSVNDVQLWRDLQDSRTAYPSLVLACNVPLHLQRSRQVYHLHDEVDHEP